MIQRERPSLASFWTVSANCGRSAAQLFNIIPCTRCKQEYRAGRDALALLITRLFRWPRIPVSCSLVMPQENSQARSLYYRSLPRCRGFLPSQVFSKEHVELHEYDTGHACTNGRGVHLPVAGSAAWNPLQLNADGCIDSVRGMSGKMLVVCMPPRSRLVCRSWPNHWVGLTGLH